MQIWPIASQLTFTDDIYVAPRLQTADSYLNLKTIKSFIYPKILNTASMYVYFQ